MHLSTVLHTYNHVIVNVDDLIRTFLLRPEVDIVPSPAPAVLPVDE